MLNFKNIIWAYADEGKEKSSFESIGSFLGKKISGEGFNLFVIDQDNFKIETANAIRIFTLENCSEPYDVAINKENVLIIHGRKSKKNQNYLSGMTVLDYSSEDPHYETMLEDIRSVDSITTLSNTIQKWIRYYLSDFRIDPVRRIKHRALNLFAPLNIDLQTIEHLWQEGQTEEIQKLCREMREEWINQESGLNLPYHELKKLWYLLIHDNVYENSVKLNPPTDLILPQVENRYQTHLYSWLKRVWNKQELAKKEPWQELLNLAGLLKEGDSFTVQTHTAIVTFCKTLEEFFRQPQEWLEMLKDIYENEQSRKNITEKRDRELIDPLGFLWQLLSVAEIHRQKMSFMDTRKRNSVDNTEHELHNELTKLATLIKDIRITSFANWYERLTHTFEKLQTTISNESEFVTD